MQIRRLLSAAAAMTLLSCLAAYAAGGTAADPIVTLGYIEGVFTPSVLASARTRATSEAQSLVPKLAAFDAVKVSSMSVKAEAVETAIEYEAVMRYLDDDNYFVAEVYTAVALQKGERLRVTVGSTFCLTQGRAALDGARGAVISDVTAGEAHYAGMAAQIGHRYILASDDIAGLRADTAAEVLVLGEYQIIPVHRSRYTSDALYLKERGLMLGSNLGLETEREATRLEGLIMFLRLVGVEQEALDYSGTHPFTDVPKWAGGLADKYVAYAYAKGYTSGVSETRFGAYENITAEQYMTFVLRALAYKDDTDFVWLTSLRDAERLGIISGYDRRSIDRTGFYRDGVARISKLALTFRK